MMVRVETVLFELQVIGLSPGRERQEPQKELVISGFFPLRQEWFRVIGVFKIAITVVTADMAGNELVTQVETQPVGIGFEREGLPCEVGWDRVAVGVQGNTKLPGGP